MFYSGKLDSLLGRFSDPLVPSKVVKGKNNPMCSKQWGSVVAVCRCQTRCENGIGGQNTTALIMDVGCVDIWPGEMDTFSVMDVERTRRDTSKEIAHTIKVNLLRVKRYVGFYLDSGKHKQKRQVFQTLNFVVTIVFTVEILDTSTTIYKSRFFFYPECLYIYTKQGFRRTVV